jgi:polysaccharide deacetylase family protein (PEP-CTERM system associated)
MTDTDKKVINALTFDIEDYRPVVARRYFGQEFTSCDDVVRDTNYLLNILGKYNVHATFFILGEVAQAFPSLVKDISLGGHEIAAHGFRHLFVDEIDKQIFIDEIITTKKLLEDILSTQVTGHRAPAFSIKLKMGWAFEALIESGFKYDSSIFPIKGRNYGDPTSPCDPFQVRMNDGSSIWEFPLPFVQLLWKRIGIGGGGYLRHFPYAFNKWGLRKINKRKPAIVYLHPDELEPIPRLEIPAGYPWKKNLKFRIFSYLQDRNRSTVKKKLEDLLREFSFDTIQNVYSQSLNNQKPYLDS